jgi:hypothetical protein
MSKTVQVLGHEFDCLASHVTIAGRGVGGNLRVAAERAIGNMLSDPRLDHKHIGAFKCSVVVIRETHREHATPGMPAVPPEAA